MSPTRLLPRRRAGLLARSRVSAQAFAEFYATTSPGVLRYFARETRDAQTAFDLMAETFAIAFEKRREFRGANDAQAAAWLWAIARNELSHYRRSRKVAFSALARLELERPHPTDAELREVENLTAVEAAQGHLLEALELLPEDQRIVIRLRFMDMLSYEEIARRLDVSQDVVRARSSRAIKALRANDELHDAVRALEA